MDRQRGGRQVHPRAPFRQPSSGPRALTPAPAPIDRRRHRRFPCAGVGKCKRHLRQALGLPACRRARWSDDCHGTRRAYRCHEQECEEAARRKARWRRRRGRMGLEVQVVAHVQESGPSAGRRAGSARRRGTDTRRRAAHTTIRTVSWSIAASHESPRASTSGMFDAPAADVAKPTNQEHGYRARHGGDARAVVLQRAAAGEGFAAWLT